MQIPCEDGIIKEMIKYGGPTLWKEITVLVKQTFKFSKVPEEWKTNITIPIFKKGGRGNPENYRWINMLNTTLSSPQPSLLRRLLKL